MSVRLAALAALVAVSAIAWPAYAADRLSLDDAFARVAQSHPDLRLFGARQDILAAERDRAALRPALTVGASIENAFGTGETRGLDGAEPELVIIDVPQVLDLVSNPNGFGYLERDCRTMADWFVRKGLDVDAGTLLAEVVGAAW